MSEAEDVEQLRPRGGHILGLAGQTVDRLLGLLDELLHQLRRNGPGGVAVGQQLNAAGGLIQRKPVVLHGFAERRRGDAPLPPGDGASAQREQQQHRHHRGDAPAALQLAQELSFLRLLRGGEAGAVGGDRGLGIGNDLGTKVGATPGQDILGFGKTSARRQQEVVVAVVAFPTRCVGLELAAHDQKVAVLGGQPGETRPMPEQGFMGEPQGLTSLAVVGDDEPRRDQAVRDVALGFGQCRALHGPGGCRSLRLVDLDERQEERRERGFEVGGELLDETFGALGDHPFQTAELPIAAIGQDAAATGFDVAAIEPRRERRTRAAARPGRGRRIRE